MTRPTVPMTPTFTLLVVSIVACGGSASSAQPIVPAVTSGEVDGGREVDGGQLFTYGNAVAYLPAGVAEYEAAIVFLPGLRDPATGQRSGLACARERYPDQRMQYLVFSGRER